MIFAGPVYFLILKRIKLNLKIIRVNHTNFGKIISFVSFLWGKIIYYTLFNMSVNILCLFLSFSLTRRLVCLSSFCLLLTFVYLFGDLSARVFVTAGPVVKVSGPAAPAAVSGPAAPLQSLGRPDRQTVAPPLRSTIANSGDNIGKKNIKICL